VAQAKELQRAKGLFQKDLQSLQQRLLGKSMEVEELKNIQRKKEKGDHQMMIEPDTWKHVDVQMLFNEVDKRIAASIERIASEASSLVRKEFASGQRELSCLVSKVWAVDSFLAITMMLHSHLTDCSISLACSFFFFFLVWIEYFVRSRDNTNRL
jgi:hypothetical protein